MSGFVSALRLLIGASRLLRGALRATTADGSRRTAGSSGGYRLPAVVPQPSKIFAPGLLDGMVCLVSGAGSGLGRETSLELARLGATVVGCGRRQQPIDETRELIAGLGGTADAIATDIRDEEAVAALVDSVLERHGRLDLLVNNAGGQFLAPAETISAKGFRTVTELNVQGTWNMTHAARPRRSSRRAAARSSASLCPPTTGCRGWSIPGRPAPRSRT